MKKKILICLYYYDPYVSGLTIYASSLAKWLVKSWYEVTVFCAQHDKNLPLQEEIDWVNIIRHKVLANFWKWVIMPTFWLKAIFLAMKHDIVNLHFPNADLGLSWLFIPKNKLYITYHCDINLWKWFVNKTIEKISFFLMWLSMFKAKNIIWNSKNYFLNSHFKKYKNKFVWIYPPIDFKTLDEWINSVWIEKNDEVYKIGFLWRIVYEKWINFLLKAIDSKHLRNINFHLYLWWDFQNVRWWSVKADLEKLVNLNKDKITFLWNIDKSFLKDFYSSIDVLVLPSIDPLESFWMVQVESLFCNTPLIASDMPWVNEVINKTWFWLLAKPKSSQDISEKLFEMYKDLPKYKTLAKDDILKNTALKTFAFDNTINDYINLYFNKN